MSKNQPHHKKETENSLIGILKNTHPIFLFVSSLLVITTLVLGYSLYVHVYNSEHQTSKVDYTKFPFLSKRVFQEDPNDFIVNFVPLRRAVKQYVAEQKGSVGVYFEYLASGASIGANDTQEFRLASLSKVPLAMSILKKVEEGKIKLDDRVVMTPEFMDNKFGTLWERGVGTSFTVDELIKYSIQESDNTAYDMLFSLLSNEEIWDVYSYLDIEVIIENNEPRVSPKSYASIFRSLYLATYLSKESSNYLLQVLSKTKFNDKIPAPIPENVLVAHKIGVFDRLDTMEKVFTDCGIVYFPLRPYVLCIFVQEDEQKAREHMTTISDMVYKYIKIVQTPRK